MSGNARHALAIANLKARYCAAADIAAGDPDTARMLFAELFTDDFVGTYTGTPLNAAQSIDFLCTAIAGNSEWMLHMLHSPRIEVDGHRGTGDWTIAAHAKRKTGELSTTLGRYSDVFHKTANGWRIARITFLRIA